MKSKIAAFLSLSLYLAVFFFALSVIPAEAQRYAPMESIGQGVSSGTKVSLSQYILTAFNTAIIAAAILTVVVLVIGGIQYIAAAGNPGKITSAKDMMVQAILGLLLILVSYLILEAINPDLVRKGLRLDSCNCVVMDQGYALNLVRQP